jgi:hypothetical protein
MANYRTALSETYGPAYTSGAARQIIAGIACTVAVTTAMIDNANDEIELGWVPAGFTVVGVEFRATDMDTDGSPALVWDVGDADDEDRILAAITTGQAAGRTDALAAAGTLYTYTTKTRIKAYVKTAAATGASGTIYFALYGFVDPNFTLANTVIGTA